MKTKVFTIFFLLFVSISFSQEVVEQPDTENAPEDYQLTDKQYASWKSIHNNWLGDDFEKIKFENKIQINCKSCGGVYMDVVLKISPSGKLEYYKLLNGKRCGGTISKQLELRIMRSFFKFEFPPELRNTTFKTRLGTSLKC